MINETVSFESYFRFWSVSENVTQQKTLKWNPKKLGTFDISTKLLKRSSDVCNGIQR